MGVKDLWQLLAPVCERKPLWELQGKTVAVDLSGWVCDSQNVVEYSSQPNMHLRNLFFRTSCLLLLGAYPVFVLEGDAPSLKLNVMTQRNASRGMSQTTHNSGKRTRFKNIQKKCQEMLLSMGVCCIQSSGEAEALCATLNANGVVDGCISQDSDCFLYGGRVVYRNFTISASSGAGGGPGFSIDMYRMEQVEDVLGLSRTKLIGLSLLCGCDYNQGGVSGVGKETAMKFLATLRDDEVFPRFYSWRSDPKYEKLEKERSLGTCDKCNHLGKKRLHDKSGCETCGTVKSCFSNCDINTLNNRNPEERSLLVNELNIRKKALQDDSFPSQDVIDEFISCKEVPKRLSFEWCQPNLIGFMRLAEKHLNWEECYSLEKFLPLLTRWLLLQPKSLSKCPIYPERIIKTRVLKGVPSYEVKWSDNEGLFQTLMSEENPNVCLTIEPQDLFNQAFPKIVCQYQENEAAKKMAKVKGKAKVSQRSKSQRALQTCSSCGKQLPTKNQSCMCRFVQIQPVKEQEKPSSSTLEQLLDGLLLSGTSSKVKACSSGSFSTTASKSTKRSCELRESMGSDLLKRSETINNQGKKGAAKELTSNKSSLKAPPDGNKLSFEYLLDGEELTVENFEEEEEIDLSDIVQVITGNKPTEGKTFENSKFARRVAPSVSEDQSQDLFITSENSAHIIPEGNSSDDETPYTPLIERVKRKNENPTQQKLQKTSQPLSMVVRRLSESFDAFCFGKNTTSSPKTIVYEDSNFTNSTSGVTFSLGITDLLENSS